MQFEWLGISGTNAQLGGVDLNQGSWKALLGTFEMTFVYTVLKLR